MDEGEEALEEVNPFSYTPMTTQSQPHSQPVKQPEVPNVRPSSAFSNLADKVNPDDDYLDGLLSAQTPPNPVAISEAVGLVQDAPALPITANPTTSVVPSTAATALPGEREHSDVPTDFTTADDVEATTLATPAAEGTNTETATLATSADDKESDSSIPGAAMGIVAEECASIEDAAGPDYRPLVAEGSNEHENPPDNGPVLASDAIPDGNVLAVALAASKIEGRVTAAHSASAESDTLYSGEAEASPTLKENSDNTNTEKQGQLGLATQLEPSGTSTEQALSESQPKDLAYGAAGGCPPTQPYSPQRALSGDSQSKEDAPGAGAGCPETQPYSPTPCTPAVAPRLPYVETTEENEEVSGKDNETLETVQNSGLVEEGEAHEGGVLDSLPEIGGASGARPRGMESEEMEAGDVNDFESRKGHGQINIDAAQDLPSDSPKVTASESYDGAVAAAAAPANGEVGVSVLPEVAPMGEDVLHAENAVLQLPATQERNASAQGQEDHDEMEESTDEMEGENYDEDDVEFGTGTQGGTDVEDEENEPTSAGEALDADKKGSRSGVLEAPSTAARTHSPAATQERMPERVEESFSSGSDDESGDDGNGNGNSNDEADDKVTDDVDNKRGEELVGGAGVKESSRRTGSLFVKMHSDEDENEDEDGLDADEPVVELRGASGGRNGVDHQPGSEGAGQLLTGDEETYISQHSPLKRHVGHTNRGSSLGVSSVVAAAEHPCTSPVAQERNNLGEPLPTSPDQVKSPFPATAPYSVSPAVRSKYFSGSPKVKHQQAITSSQELVAGLAIRAAEDFDAAEAAPGQAKSTFAASGMPCEGSGSSSSNSTGTGSKNDNKSGAAQSDGSATVMSTNGGGPLWLSACNSADASPYCSAADPEKPSSSHAASGEASTGAPATYVANAKKPASEAGVWMSTGRKPSGQEVTGSDRVGDKMNHSPLEWSKVHPLQQQHLPTSDASTIAADSAPEKNLALDSAVVAAKVEASALEDAPEPVCAAKAMPSTVKQPAAVLPSTTTPGLNTTEWVPRPQKPTTPAATLPAPDADAAASAKADVAASADSMSDDDEDFVPRCDDGLENTQEGAPEPVIRHNESSEKKRRIKRNSEATSIVSTTNRPSNIDNSSKSSSSGRNQNSSESNSSIMAKEEHVSKNAGGLDDGQGGFSVAMRRAEDRKRAKVSSIQAHAQVTTTTTANAPLQPRPQVLQQVALTPLAPLAHITSPSGVPTAQSTASTPTATITATNDAATAASSLHTVLSFLERQWSKGAMDHQQYLQLVTQAVADAQPQGSAAGVQSSTTSTTATVPHVSEGASSSNPAAGVATITTNTTLAAPAKSTAESLEGAQTRRPETIDQAQNDASSDNDDGFQDDGGGEWSDGERDGEADPFALPRDSAAERSAITNTSSPFKRKAKATAAAASRVESSTGSKRIRHRASVEIADGDEEEDEDYEVEAVFDDSLKHVHGQSKASAKPRKSLPLSLHADAHRGVKWAPLWKHLSTQLGWFHMPGDLTHNYFYVRPRSGAPAATTYVEQGDERKAAEKARKAQVRSGKLVQGHGDSGLEVDYFVHDHAVIRWALRYALWDLDETAHEPSKQAPPSSAQTAATRRQSTGKDTKAQETKEVTPRQSLASRFAEARQVGDDRESDEEEDEAPADQFWDRESQNVPLGELLARENRKSPAAKSNKTPSSLSSSKKRPSEGNKSSVGSAPQAQKKKPPSAQDWWNAAKKKGWQYAAGSGLAAWVYLRPGYTKKTAELGVSMFNSLEDAMAWEKANASSTANSTSSSSFSLAANFTSSPSSCTNPTAEDADALAHRALLVGREDLAAQLTALSSSIGSLDGADTSTATWASAVSAVAAAEREQKSLMDAFAPRTSRTKTTPNEAKGDLKAEAKDQKEVGRDKRERNVSSHASNSSKSTVPVGKSAQQSKAAGKKVASAEKNTPARDNHRGNERDSGGTGSKRNHAAVRKTKPGKVANSAASPMNLQPTKLADQKEDDIEFDGEHDNDDNVNDDYHDNRDGNNDDNEPEPEWVLEPGEVSDLFPDVGADLLMRPGPSSGQSALKNGKPSGAPLTGRVIGWQPCKSYMSRRDDLGRDECAEAGEGRWLVRFDACDWGDGRGVVEKKQLFEGNHAVGTMAAHFETAQPLTSKRTAQSFMKSTSAGISGSSSSSSGDSSTVKAAHSSSSSTTAAASSATSTSSLLPPRAKASRLKPRVSSSPVLAPGNYAPEQQDDAGMSDDDEGFRQTGEEETQETQRQLLESTQATQAEMPRHLLDNSTQATQAQSPLGHRAQKSSTMSSPLPSSPLRPSVQLPMSPPQGMASSSKSIHGEVSHQPPSVEKGGGSGGDGSAPIEQVVNALFASTPAPHGISDAPANKSGGETAVADPSLLASTITDAPSEAPIATATADVPCPRVSPRKRQVVDHRDPVAVEVSPNPGQMKEGNCEKKLKVSPSTSAPNDLEASEQVPVITPIIKSPLSSEVAFAPKWNDSMLDGDFASVLWPALRRMGWFQASELYGRPQANVAAAAKHAQALKVVGTSPGGEASTLVLETRNAARRDGFFATEIEVRQFCKEHHIDGSMRVGKINERHRKSSGTGTSSSSSSSSGSSADLNAAQASLFKGLTFMLSGFESQADRNQASAKAASTGVGERLSHGNNGSNQRMSVGTPGKSRWSSGSGTHNMSDAVDFEPTKEELQEKLVRCGATVVDQVPLPPPAASPSSLVLKGSSSSSTSGISSSTASSANERASSKVDVLLSVARGGKRLKYLQAVAMDGCHLLHPQWVDDCIRAGTLVAPLDPYHLPLGFARAHDRATNPSGQDRSKGAWLFADDGAIVEAPRMSDINNTSNSTASSATGTRTSSSDTGHRGGAGKRASSSSSDSRRSSSGGFEKAPLQGLTLRVVCSDKTLAANMRLLVLAAGAHSMECVAKASKASAVLVSPAKSAAASRASQWAMEASAAKCLDAQICDELCTEEMRLACNQVPGTKVLTYEWLMQCLLHRRRVDDTAYLLRPVCASKAAADDVDAAWVQRDKAVLKVKDGVRYEVGDSVRYEASPGAAIAVGRIKAFPVRNTGKTTMCSGATKETSGAEDDHEQCVELFEMRKPANGHPREVMVNSIKKVMPASSLRGRVIVLGKADFERRVYASRDSDIFFSKT